MTLSEIRQTLEKRGLRPLKQFGQNFLFDANLCRFIVDSLPVNNSARVLEIGPGLGALTEMMLKKNWRVTAIETDRGLCDWLKEKFQNSEHFSLVEGDALRLLSQYPHPHIIGNLPYNISTPLLAELLKLDPLPRACVFTLQKETGQRLAAQPRTKDYGIISVAVQRFYKVEILKTLPRGVFFPEPKVESIVARLTIIPEEAASVQEREGFYRFLKLGFSHRRKMLKSVLPVPLTARAEELSIQEWIQLYQTVRPS
ncbi:MAG: 16S rRNA (adenine(1518)-N(6)/adenine(1519)-N(6))-dimethyltransferase RsmA [bacterium]